MKKLLSVILSITVLFTVATPVVASETITETVPAPAEWARESVDIATELGITDEKQYMYKEPITREEFCELLYNYVNVLGIDIEDASEDFTDTDNKSVAALCTMGIITGKTETEFAPNDFLTREEAATIIVRMVNKVMPVPATEMWFEFDDLEDISEWAADSIQTICNLGFMSGVGNNSFAPKEWYTTEQAIVTIVRAYECAEAAGIIDRTTDIGGADNPTEIVVTEKIDINDFYIEEAIKLTTESGKRAADKDFISYYTANDDMTAKILEIGAVDYSEPTEIYYMSADREKIVENIKALYGEEVEALNIEKLLEFNIVNFSVLANLINASYGAENLAALAILANSEGYIMPKDFENDFALFLKYDGEYSALVSFSEYGKGVISANMSFVKNGDKDTVFSRVYEIVQGLGEGSINIAKVNL